MARYLQEYREYMRKLLLNRHFRFGVPFIIFVVGGSFALEQFAKVRYEFRKVNPYGLPDNEDNSLVSTVTPEEEYEKIKQINLDNWENKRVPRPWEPNEGQELEGTT